MVYSVGASILHIDVYRHTYEICTYVDVCLAYPRYEWLGLSPPFWMSVVMLRADRPLLQRQRAAVGRILALKREELGEELRVVRDKLQVEVLERQLHISLTI